MRRSPRCVTRNVSVSFFFFVFIYLTFTIFLATIIVLEGIGIRYRDRIYCYTRWTPHVRMHMPHLDVTGQVATSPCQHLSSTDKAAGCGTFLVVVFSFFRTFFLFYFLSFHFTNKCLQLGSLRLRPPPTPPPPPPLRITASTNGCHLTPSTKPKNGRDRDGREGV